MLSLDVYVLVATILRIAVIYNMDIPIIISGITFFLYVCSDSWPEWSIGFLLTVYCTGHRVTNYRGKLVNTLRRPEEIESY